MKHLVFLQVAKDEEKRQEPPIPQEPEEVKEKELPVRMSCLRTN